jgi:processive 1,2-diacylglycerol beta-glucosyltransferase
MKTSKKQKLLLISCSGGMGHIRAAEALQAHCKKFYPEITCEHFNAAEYSGWFLNTSLVKSYEFLIKKHPKVFGTLFKLADTAVGKKYIELHTPLLRRSGEPLIDAIAHFKPDRIIVTHPIVMPLLEKLPFAPPIDVVVTDYYANKMWLHPNIRHLFVATPEMKEELTNEHSSIIVSGIPLNPVFFEEKNRADLQKKYQLPFDQKTILIMSGGQGLIDTSAITKKTREFQRPLTVIAISGKGNTKLLRSLQNLRKNHHTYLPLEFTTSIDEYMRLSDLVVTKPGGLTITECLYLKKPILMTNPIPGQEQENAKYIEKYNFGKLLNNIDGITHILESIYYDKFSFLHRNEKFNPNQTIIETN